MTAGLDRFGGPERSDPFVNVLTTGVGADVTECDREPISVPESIQPHGALLLLDETDLHVRRVSANAYAFVEGPVTELVGAPLGRALGPAAAAVVAEQVDRVREGRIGPLVLPLTASAGDAPPERLCDLTLHRPGPGQLILEIEENLAARHGVDVSSALLRLQAAPDLVALLELTVLEVARLSGFGRVMLYRFNNDGDGEVLAEQVPAGEESYLGLRYPASDIPRQARELYRRQWLRLIVSSDYQPSPLVPTSGAEALAPLDLSHAALRSVSPVHLQYLRNMGVGSSMSMSLVVEDRLWGLILCHGRERHLVPSALRTACEQLAQFVSMQIQTRWETARLAADLRAQRLRTLLIDQMAAPAPADGLIGGAFGGPDEVGLLDIVPAEAAAGRLRGRTVVTGDGPDVDTVDRLVALLRSTDGVTREAGWSTSCLRVDLPAAARLLDGAGQADIAGLLLAPSTADADDYLIWMRREVEQTVNWAGEPAVKHQSGTLSPRASFALWREKVRDHSDPWQTTDLAASGQLADAVGARLRRLDETALAATASRTAELFAREHEIADTLQRGMLPVLPVLPGLSLSASYVTAGESAEVGGDWYDVFTLPDGSIGIAMGDVTGHDVPAAAAMGQLRSILRSYAWEEPAPERVLDKVDALVAGFAMQRMATVFFGRLERDDAGSAGFETTEPPTTRFRYANAGHLPPVLRLPDGSAELLDDGVSVLIGVGLGIAHEASSRLVPPGSTLLLYTDGLVEERTRPISDGIEALRRAVAEGPDDADGLREHVLTRLAPSRQADDIAVLVVRLDA